MQTDTKPPGKATGTLADYTNTALMVAELRGRTPAAVMQELNDVMQRTEGIVPDRLFSGVAALNRELLTSTDLTLRT